MEDEKGGQMGVTIYGDDIASYAEVIKCRKEYEISDAVKNDSLVSGCDACGSKTYEAIGTNYKCSKSSCTSRTSTSVARMIFQFDLVDITGSWNVTLFSDDASKVLGIEADKLYGMEYEYHSEGLNVRVQKFGCADGFDFARQHEWWSLMVFGYFVKTDSDG
ncbi:hypothetical protein Cgig2_026314 [Carnegiea gigantea]|uniref:Replication factor A C-terminal domain-containing protein n=1 Tax=Carnegiea gigantea TaxID=171969 RepID=A0A9Q1KER9_9CARY|nr:hypothetical protein Cgig2_026314 [Carnegiea gigantea]